MGLYDKIHVRYIYLLPIIIELLRYIGDTSGYIKIHVSSRIHAEYMHDTLGYVSDRKTPPKR